jgi:hypothetical protein
MATKKDTKKQIGVGVGVGVAMAAAAAAGAYWFYGSTDAPKNRKAVRSWMLKARAEVLEAVEKLGDIDKKTYLDIVDRVVKRYSGAAGATSAEVVGMARDLKAAWQHMQASKTAGVAKKSLKKAVKKAVKKAA